MFLFSASRSTTTRTFSGPRIGLGSLSTTGQSCSVSSPPVATEIGKSLDIHRDFTTKITLYHVLILNDLTDAIDIVAIKVIAVHRMWQIHLVQYFSG
jgi:hypothetical protein